MQLNHTVFRKKILSFTVIQVVLLSFLLFFSVVLRIFLYPLDNLESFPLYSIVGFFFVWEMSQFIMFSFWKNEKRQGVRAFVFQVLLLRLLASALVGYAVCFLLSEQAGISLMVFLLFFVVELFFDVIYYRGWWGASSC